MQVICANCGIKIRWQPTIIEEKTYCCWGCSQGGPCTCDYSNLPLSTDSVALTCYIVAKQEMRLLQDYKRRGKCNGKDNRY